MANDRADLRTVAGIANPGMKKKDSQSIIPTVDVVGKDSSRTELERGTTMSTTSGKLAASSKSKQIRFYAFTPSKPKRLFKT